MLWQNGMCNECMEGFILAATTPPEQAQPELGPSSPAALASAEGARARSKRPAEEDAEKLRAGQHAEQRTEQRAEQQDEGADATANAGTGEAPLPAPQGENAQEGQPRPPIDWARSWYEILGVARNAQATTIKAAYRRLSAPYHPDKAGTEHTATMQRINHIYSILSNPATRKAYNKNLQDFPFPGNTWRADADAPEDDATAGQQGHPSARGDASKDEPDFGQTFTLRWEPVNVAAVEKALMLAAIRSVRMENYDCFEILLSIRKRAVKVRRGSGSIPVVERASQTIGSLKNRLYSGIRGIDPAKLPSPIRAELERGVPSELAGLSIFAFSKPISIPLPKWPGRQRN